MAAKKWRLARFYGALEAAFGVDPSPSGSTYQFIKVLEDATFQPEAEVVERPGLVNDFSRQPHVVGVKGGTISLKLEMKASGTPGTAAAAIASESGIFLESCLGTVVRGQGTTVGAASGDGGLATPLKVTSATGLARYMMISVAGEHRFIKSISGTDVVLDRPLPSNPTSGLAVTASSLYRRAVDGHKSLAIVADRDGVQFTFLGCTAQVKLEGINARGTAILAVELQVGTWSATSKASLPPSKPSGISAVRAPVVKGAPFAIDGVTRMISSIEFDPGHEFVFQDSTEAENVKTDIELVNANPQGTFRPYYNADHVTDFVNGTEKEIAFTCGTISNGFGIFIPKAQYLQPTLEDTNQLVGESVPFAVNDNGSDADFVICQF